MEAWGIFNCTEGKRLNWSYTHMHRGFKQPPNGIRCVEFFVGDTQTEETLHNAHYVLFTFV